MITTHKCHGKVYTLSNENLKVGDEVFPISWGQIINGKYIHEEYYIDDTLMSEDWSPFPNDPHIIEDLHYSSLKSYEICTNHGYGPVEKYYKIIDIKDDNTRTL